MKRIAALLVSTLIGLSFAQAAPYAVYSRTQRGSTITIEHTPIPHTIGRTRVSRVKVTAGRRKLRRASVRRAGRRGRLAIVRRYPDNALAGECRDGGLVRRQVAPLGVVTLQREICEGFLPP